MMVVDPKYASAPCGFEGQIDFPAFPNVRDTPTCITFVTRAVVEIPHRYGGLVGSLEQAILNYLRKRCL